MTNEEKFKTPEERLNAFNMYCGDRACINCQLDKIPYAINGRVCMSRWLALEADEEEPIPCPCCGAEVHTVHVERPSECCGYKVVCERCGLQTGLEETLGDAVALWNRRVK